MSTTRSSRTPNVRVLFTALAWLIVIATVFSVSAALSKGSTNNFTGMFTAAIDVTAVFFLMALRCPWLRKQAGARRAGVPELAASWTMYRKEILRIAIYAVLGNLMLLFAIDLSLYLIVARSAENQGWDALGGLFLFGTAAGLYALATKAFRSMQDKTKAGAPYHPVLGMVLGSLLTVVISLLALFLMSLFTALAWQVVVPCLVAGVTLFVAALITLDVISTAKS
ncbi:hypothetical protein AB0H37_12685 [Actinomadura sp. NPDC023710]|uniref:hypothetical protein n=1 Tax=Actinomadura sp. NPDC023710 TaxID=3158219 RepID=UPI0033CB65D2